MGKGINQCLTFLQAVLKIENDDEGDLIAYRLSDSLINFSKDSKGCVVYSERISKESLEARDWLIGLKENRKQKV